MMPAGGMMPGPMPMPMMQMAMPQMIAGANPSAGGPVAPQVMMMPMPIQAMAAPGGPGGVQQMNALMAPEAVSPQAMQMPLNMDPNQYGGMQAAREAPAGAYPESPQAYQPNAGASPTFRDVCSPTYQSTQAYEQYVRDIMNADGDEFHFA
jgi:hypothetical protein